MSYLATQVINQKCVSQDDTFEEIYDTYFNRILSYAHYRIGDEESASEITARTFERVFRNIHKYEPSRAPFSSWIFSIASNELKNFYRERKRHNWCSLEQIAPPISTSTGPLDSLLQKETYNYLCEALSCLKERDKNILSLKFGGRLTNREIGKILNISASNVGVLLYRSIQKLKKHLENRKVIL